MVRTNAPDVLCGVSEQNAVLLAAPMTPRDLLIAETLACRVSVMSIDQIARGWWPGSKHAAFNARQRMKKMTNLGLAARYRVHAERLPSPENPIYTWEPGQAKPSSKTCQAVSYALRERWVGEQEEFSVYTATKRSAALFGSWAGGLKSTLHTSHDLLLSEVYLYYRNHHPAMAACWVGEQMLKLAGHGIADPDAFIARDRSRVGSRISPNNVLRVVESGGRYSADRVAAIVGYCIERNLLLEVW